MQALIALAIIAVLVLLYLAAFRSGNSAAAGLSGGASPLRPVDTWKTAPTQITVGTPAAFVFESMNNNPLAISTPQLTPIVGRTIGFSTSSSDIQIVSIDTVSVGGTTGTGTTTAPNGLVTVVIIANRLPDPADGEDTSKGALIGIPGATTSTRAVANFTVVP